MRVFAPGKLVLTGAYAVLYGAPSIVVATSRGVVADASQVGVPSHEVRTALGDEPAPKVFASALFDGERKLGLGASAAVLVASLGARLARDGADLGASAVRAELFHAARRAHAQAQGGGSGVDIAASVFGGALAYTQGELPRRVSLPRGLSLSVFAAGTSARTSDLRARIDAFAERSPDRFRACMEELTQAAARAAEAVASDDRAALVEVVRRTADGLDALGRAADAGIVPPEVSELASAARQESAAFCVSGAGGGDVIAFLGSAPPSAEFVRQAKAKGLSPLDVAIDDGGVRRAPLEEPETDRSRNRGTP